MTISPDRHPEPKQDDHPLASIMAFLGSEIDRSSAMLQDLAACLSEVVVTLTENEDDADFRLCLSSATQALQNEDRIQQRLGDMRRTLMILEHVLDEGVWPSAARLDHSIIDQLHLEEMRYAYAVSVGVLDQLPKKVDGITKPSAGDVDLF